MNPNKFFKSRIYRRFYRVPSLITSALVSCLLVHAVLCGIVLSSPACLWAGAGIGCTIGVSILSIHPAMVRSRLYEWGKDKFDSWDEFGDWLKNTNDDTLELALSLKDDKWIPKTGGKVQLL